MNKTIAEDVSQTLKRAAERGKDEALSQQATLVRNVMGNPAGLEVIWTDPRNGLVVGSAFIRSTSPHAMKAVISDLAVIADETVQRFEEQQREKKFGLPAQVRLDPKVKQ